MTILRRLAHTLTDHSSKVDRGVEPYVRALERKHFWLPRDTIYLTA